MNRSEAEKWPGKNQILLVPLHDIFTEDECLGTGVIQYNRIGRYQTTGGGHHRCPMTVWPAITVSIVHILYPQFVVRFVPAPGGYFRSNQSELGLVRIGRANLTIPYYSAESSSSVVQFVGPLGYDRAVVIFKADSFSERPVFNLNNLFPGNLMWAIVLLIVYNRVHAQFRGLFTPQVQVHHCFQLFLVLLQVVLVRYIRSHIVDFTIQDMEFMDALETREDLIGMVEKEAIDVIVTDEQSNELLMPSEPSEPLDYQSIEAFKAHPPIYVSYKRSLQLLQQSSPSQKTVWFGRDEDLYDYASDLCGFEFKRLYGFQDYLFGAYINDRSTLPNRVREEQKMVIQSEIARIRERYRKTDCGSEADNLFAEVNPNLRDTTKSHGILDDTVLNRKAGPKFQVNSRYSFPRTHLTRKLFKEERSKYRSSANQFDHMASSDRRHQQIGQLSIYQIWEFFLFTALLLFIATVVFFLESVLGYHRRRRQRLCCGITGWTEPINTIIKLCCCFHYQSYHLTAPYDDYPL